MECVIPAFLHSTTMCDETGRHASARVSQSLFSWTGSQDLQDEPDWVLVALLRPARLCVGNGVCPRVTGSVPVSSLSILQILQSCQNAQKGQAGAAGFNRPRNRPAAFRTLFAHFSARTCGRLSPRKAPALHPHCPPPLSSPSTVSTPSTPSTVSPFTLNPSLLTLHS